MGPIDDGPWQDPFEDPTDRPSSTAPGAPGAEPHEAPHDFWVTGEAISEILALELMYATNTTHCPRCGHWSFTYATVRICSFDCPENLCEGEPSC